MRLSSPDAIAAPEGATPSGGTPSGGARDDGPLDGPACRYDPAAGCLSGAPDRPWFWRTKRALDLALALPLLVALSPLMAAIALLVRLDSAGPSLFVQRRVGARRERGPDGRAVWRVRIFPFLKFRSMTHGADADAHRAEVRAFVRGRAGEGAGLKKADDPRITRVGRLLRRTSLDELPQLLNVLRGEMSLVGPRPVPPYEVEEYRPDHYERLAAWPGITGPWQVRGRDLVPFEEMVRLDVAYVRAASLRGDLAILLQTVPAVLTGRGAK